MANSPFTDVPAAIEEIRAGRMVVVVDDEDRENEGDLTLAAEKVTPEAINFMAKYGRGLVCLAMTEERLDHLRIGPMTAENTSNYGTAFCEAIDARDGVTTGISAYDRARTIRVAVDPATRPADLARPGHVFPLRARKGGVLLRAGQTEAAVDLARMAGMVPAGIICEIMRDDGTMARVPDLIEFCKTHGLKMLTVAELIRYRMQHERHVHRVGEALIDTNHGEFRLIAYESEVDGGESHIALVRGDIESGDEPVLVRMHSHCLMGDVFGSTGCDCHATIEGSMQRIAREGRGRADLPASDFQGLFGGETGGADRAYVSSRQTYAGVARERAQDAARGGHRGADLVGPEPAAHTAAYQPSPQSRRPRGIRHRDRGTDSGVAGTSAKQAEYLERSAGVSPAVRERPALGAATGAACRPASWRTGVSPAKRCARARRAERPYPPYHPATAAHTLLVQNTNERPFPHSVHLHSFASGD